MIFVILGILILIFSFVIAFISLVREQNKLGRADKELFETQKTAEGPKESGVQKYQASEAAPAAPVSADENRFAGETASAKDEHFPWEQEPIQQSAESSFKEGSRRQGAENISDTVEERHGINLGIDSQDNKQDEKTAGQDFNSQSSLDQMIEVSMKDIIEKSKSGD